MTSIPPALQVFWNGPVAASPAFAVLSGWADLVQAPMPEALQPPKPPSHISAAVRRIVDTPPPLSGPEPVLDRMAVLQDRREYAGGLLRLCLEKIVEGLERPEEASSLLEPLAQWMPEIGDTLRDLENERGRFRVALSEAELAGRIPSAGADWLAEVALRLSSRLERAYVQVAQVSERMTGHLNESSFQEIRRRLSWVLGLREFARTFDWESLPASSLEKIPAERRFDVGMILLFRFRPDATDREVSLYERAASSKVRGRDLAFAVDGVLADALTDDPSRFEATDEDVVFQNGRPRLPRREMQALVMGLWAAENRLRVVSDGADDEAVFNDFPLLKIAFGFAAPKDAGRVVSRQDLRDSRRYMDAFQRRAAWKRNFETPEGRRFLEALGVDRRNDVDFLKESRIPYPDFPFDLLIGRPDVTAERIAALGFGRRWMPPAESAEATLRQLVRFFSEPIPAVSETVLDWLDTWEIT